MFTIIVVVSAIFPDGVKIGRHVIHCPDLRKWLTPDTVAYRDIQSIIASVDTVDHPFEPVLPVESDSVVEGEEAKAVVEFVPQRFSADVADESVRAFEFQDGQDTLLFPFFRSVVRARQRNAPVRILHYGDSQMEGDRITSTIRNYMQRNYGGQGIGFLPIVPANVHSVKFQKDISPQWTRFSILDRGAGRLESNRYGISGNLARHAPASEDDTTAHIGLRPHNTWYRNARTFTHVRLFYGQAEKPFDATLNQDLAQRLPAADTVSSALWRFDAPQNSLDLLLSSSSLPDLYGIALDGENGVAVDNLPLRGSSGLDFGRMDTVQMGQMFRMMNVEMLILQFGANVVPNVLDNYDFYRRRFAQELRLLKALKPGLSIIVMGVNDMSQNTPDGYKSYPNIVMIRDAQRRAAFETGCAFWDLYEAMGGENSMPDWVFAEPPLAQKDFTHFSVDGAKIVAELFCKAWEREFHKFWTRFGK